MIAYQKRQLPADDVGEPGDLPAELQGLADISLADLIWTDAALSYHGFGYFPVEVDDPPAPIPIAVTQLQFRRALRHFGLYEAVVAYVATQSAETQEAFDYASMVRRDSPSLNAGADALLAEAGQSTLDAVFLYAADVVE